MEFYSGKCRELGEKNTTVYPIETDKQKNRETEKP
jgi:hypothetical protein